MSLLGLLCQRKKHSQELYGVLKTVMWILDLGAGAGYLINSCSPVVQELNKSYYVKGVHSTKVAVLSVLLKFEVMSRNAV